MSVSFNAPKDLPTTPIAMELRQDTYLLFKEALQNVLKHAQARHVRVDVTYKAPHLAVRVVDDGVGFYVDDPGGGNGLELMKQRAAKHRGTVTFSSAPERGTEVELRMRMK